MFYAHDFPNPKLKTINFFLTFPTYNFFYSYLLSIFLSLAQIEEFS